MWTQGRIGVIAPLHFDKKCVARFVNDSRVSYICSCCCFVRGAFQEAVYFFLTIVCGLVFGVFWGAVYGLVDFFTVWFLQPAISIYFVAMRWTLLILRATVRSLMDPLFESVSKTLQYRSFRRVQLMVQSAAAPLDMHSQQYAGAPVQLAGYA